MNNRKRLLAVYALALCGVAVSVVILPGQSLPTIFTNSPLPQATQGASYFEFLSSSIGGASWSLVPNTGSLPPGLAVNLSGYINGTPSTPGTFTFTIRANNGFVNASKPFELTVNPPPALPPSLPSACLAVPYSAPVAPVNGTAPYFYSVNNASIPPGLIFNGPPPPSFADTQVKAARQIAGTSFMGANQGTLSGIPTQAGNFALSLTVSDSNFATVTGNIPIAVLAPPVLQTPTLPLATVGQAYSTQLQSAGSGVFSVVSSTAPFTVSVSPTGVLSATPTVAGSFQVQVRATSPALNTCFTQHTYTLDVVDQLSIITTALPPGRVGLSYSSAVQTTGGVPPVSFRVQNGTFPPGLTLASGGAITGTPTQAGNFTFTIEAQDSRPANSGGPRLATRTFTVAIEGPLEITTTALPNGLTQQAYSATLTATGGTTPYAWSLATGTLPAGLQLNSNGTITGTPTTAGTSTFTVRVTSAPLGTLGSQTVTRQLSITIESSLTVVTTALQSGIRGRFYTADLQARGGVPPYQWSLAQGTLPEGLSLLPTGTITGTPTRIETASFTVRVTDTAGASATRALSISIEADTRGVLITTPSIPNGDVSTDYRAVVSATGGFPPYRWSAENLPPGLSINASDGTITGRPTRPGTYQVFVRVADAQGNGDSSVYNVVISGVPVTITTTSVASGSVDVAYSQAIAASGGTPGYTFAITSGSLPAGLSMTNAGVISGTPTQAGSSTFTVEATDTQGVKGNRSFTLVVNAGAPTISTETLGPAVVNRPFTASLSGRGGTAPYRFSATGLPAGLQIADNGQISGTPTEAGSFSVNATVTDRDNRTGSRSYTFVVAPLLQLQPATFATQITGQTVNVSVTAAGGLQPYQFTGGGGLPGGLTLTGAGVVTGVTNETGSFTFTATVRDQSGQEATREYTLSVQQQLRITTTALPAATVGAAYTGSVQATGGVPPYTFSAVGDTPPGLSVGSGGQITGTYTSTQAGSITVRVEDAGGQSTQATFAIAANLPQAPTPSIGGLPSGGGASGQQTTPTLQITQQFPVPITGNMTLTFAPNAAVAGDDPAVRFGNNTRTINFNIPAGQTAAQFVGSPAFQTGTVAGTITITAVLTANGQQVGTTTQTFVVARAVPVITNAVARRSGNTITLEVTGFSNTREVTNVILRFTGAAGANLQTTELTVNAGSAFATYFQSQASQALGSQFKLTLPLTVEGDAATAITGVSVTVANTVGNSQPRDATIQ